MKNKLVSKTLFNSCLLATLASIACVTPAHAQSPGVFSKLNVGDSTGSTTGDGTFVAEGKNSVSQTLASTYQTAGSRMLWYPRKSAFRAGEGDATTWSEATMGQHSVAMGFSNIASNDGSTAMGASNTASGFGSTAMGYANTASSVAATAMGSGNFANSEYGWGATAMGYFNIASGEGSTAVGFLNNATGWGATAMGHSNYASSFGETVIGSNNQSFFGDPWVWNSNDPVFQIGNGHEHIYETQTQTDYNGDGVIDQNWEVYLPGTYSNALTVF